jgi:UDP-glucose 4-epimerase
MDEPAGARRPEDPIPLGGASVLVTGASGFIGGHLCAALRGLGARVFAASIDRDPPAGTTRIDVDLRSFEAAAAAMETSGASVVFHLAGHVDTSRAIDLVRPTLENNLVATVNVLEAAQSAGCDRVVVVGSSEEVQGAHDAPTSPYAASKAAVREYAMMFSSLYATPVVVARPFMCYGPGQAPDKLVPHTIVSLLAGNDAQLASGNRLCDFVYVEDLVSGLIECAVRPGMAGRTVDLGTGQAHSVREVADLIASAIGGPGRPVYGALSDRTGETRQAACARTENILPGWRPRWTLEDGLNATIEWYRRNG